MNQKFKRILSLMVTMVFVLCTMTATDITASAASEYDVWYVGKAADGTTNIGWHGNGGVFSVDTDNYYGDSRYSIKMDNGDAYRYTRVEKTIALEENTTYKFSAWVKTSGFEVNPDAENKDTGAFIKLSSRYDGVLYRRGETEKITSGQWTKLEIDFTTGFNDGEVYLFRLCNGFSGGECKGTAWFSDIKIEKQTKTNQWNVLTLVFKNIEADVTRGGTSFTHKHNLNDEDVAYLKTQVMDPFGDRLKEMTGDIVGINRMDTYVIDTVLTEEDLVYREDRDDYVIEYNSDTISSAIRKYTAKENYQQIVLYVPMNDIASWAGRGGTKFDGINICSIVYRSGDKSATRVHPAGNVYPQALLMHEIAHGVENLSEKISPDDTAYIHDGEKYECYTKDDNGYEFQKQLWTKTLPGGMGFHPLSYWRDSGEYVMFSDDMTVGGWIDASALPLSLLPVYTLGYHTVTYTGKPIEFDLTLRDGWYTLKEGTDYTVSYSDNINTGTGYITVKGKGIYTGEQKIRFFITDDSYTKEDAILDNRIDRAIRAGNINYAIKLLERRARRR